MAHVSGNQPDDRQDDEKIAATRFRPRYGELSDEEKAVHDEIKAKAEELGGLFDRVADGRRKSLALTELETSIMWIVKELTGDGGLKG